MKPNRRDFLTTAGLAAAAVSMPRAARAQNAGGGKSNPKDSRAGSKHNAPQKQGGVSKATQSNRKQGDR